MSAACGGCTPGAVVCLLSRIRRHPTRLNSPAIFPEKNAAVLHLPRPRWFSVTGERIQLGSGKNPAKPSHHRPPGMDMLARIGWLPCLAQIGSPHQSGQIRLTACTAQIRGCSRFNHRPAPPAILQQVKQTQIGDRATLIPPVTSGELSGANFGLKEKGKDLLALLVCNSKSVVVGLKAKKQDQYAPFANNMAEGTKEEKDEKVGEGAHLIG